MQPTKNDLPQAKRQKLTAYLSQLLADAIDLKSQSKQAHWNVKGENFIALHELFDKVASQADEAVDLIAERIIQLGGEAEGALSSVAKRTQLKPYPLLAADGQAHADALSTAVATFNEYARKGIDDTDDLGEKVTADMLTNITRGLDKLLWMVEAHTQTASQAKMALRKVR